MLLEYRSFLLSRFFSLCETFNQVLRGEIYRPSPPRVTNAHVSQVFFFLNDAVQGNSSDNDGRKGHGFQVGGSACCG